MSPPSLSAEAQRALARLVRAAAQHVRCYREEWARAGVDAARFDPSKDLARLPVVTKADLRRYAVEGRLDERLRREQLKRLTTSGSTGQPFEVFLGKRDLRARQWRTLAGIWHAGYRPGRRFLWLKRLRAAGDARSSLTQRLARLSYINVLQDPADVFRQYRAQRPDIVYGQLSALSMLADSTGADRKHVPRIVIGFGEQLAASVRDNIRRGLGTDVTDFYGNTEVGLIAVRRPDEPHFHLVGSDLVLEYLPAEGAPGYERLILTCLSATATPFIRFDTGDLVRREFGLPGAPIVALGGKALHFISFPSGKRVGPYLIDEAIFEMPGLEQYRIVQHADYVVELFLRYTGERKPAEVAAYARTALERLCGPELVLRVSDYEERADDGVEKLRLIESRVGQVVECQPDRPEARNLDEG